MERELCDEGFGELFLEEKGWFDLVGFDFGGRINIYEEVGNLSDKGGQGLQLGINYNDMVVNEKLVESEGYESNVEG